MAKGNGHIKIDTEIDKSGLNKGINDIEKAFSGLNKIVKGAGIAAYLQSCVKIMKSMYSAVQDTAQAYNGAIKSEKLLQASAKNNPYLNKESVEQLKKFADELQSVSTTSSGDLQTLMAQLANAGRTQTEIMDIMSASLDLSATGAVSLETAVQSLNLSYTGSVGALGKLVPALKTLTAEQLKSGDAVAYVKKQYAGTSEEMTKQTGSYQQMKVAADNFKEALGRITKPTSDSWNNFWKGWYEQGIKEVEKLEARLQKMNDRAKFESFHGKIDVRMKGKSSDEVASEWTESQLTDLIRFYTNNSDQLSNNELDYLATMLEARSKIQAKNKADEEHAKKQLELEQKQAELAEAEAKSAQEKEDYKTNNQTSLDQKLKEIETEYNLQKELGETTDENAYHQERLNAMMESYVSLLADSNGEVTESSELALQRIAQIKEEAAAIKEMPDAFAEWQTAIENVNSVFSQLSSISSSISDLAEDNVDARAETATADAEKQYADGLISYEEYCDKLNEIDKEQAEEKYKYQMAEWTMSLATATANIAEGVTKAIAQGGVMGIVNGALVSAAGAIQLASIIANKPTKNFSSGGIVGGTSYTGDNVHAGLNSGEIVANRQQQAALWRAMNGGGAGGFSQSITIENNAADSVSIGQSVSEDKLIFTVNKIVNSEMKRGTYTGSMLEANSKVNGVKYL